MTSPTFPLLFRRAIFQSENYPQFFYNHLNRAHLNIQVTRQHTWSLLLCCHGYTRAVSLSAHWLRRNTWRHAVGRNAVLTVRFSLHGSYLLFLPRSNLLLDHMFVELFRLRSPARFPQTIATNFRVFTPIDDPSGKSSGKIVKKWTQKVLLHRCNLYECLYLVTYYAMYKLFLTVVGRHLFWHHLPQSTTLQSAVNPWKIAFFVRIASASVVFKRPICNWSLLHLINFI